ncbi:hypothetical protein [Bacillus pseudomycoides]|uniref:hypothetical protein n=1 Tax=Bacillus pseudomycoides TaxID=64104 RepID=UPI0001A15070|nr:hypothetical protein [Bacillus pseudomycoides]EEM02232.1 hypothetical protein bmyco0002_54270 [Bacillus pseudomycoides]
MNNEKQRNTDHTYPVEGKYCSNEGEKVCSGDRTFVCKNNHWIARGEFCPDDSTM